MKKLYIIILFMNTVGTGTVFAEGSCPVLNLGNIGDAACATKAKPFTTGELAGVKFHAVTACPSGIWKKKLLGMFKGKEYRPTAQSVTPGMATCTYSIDDAWQKVLVAKSKTLVFDISLPTREHANFWSSRGCLPLKSTDVEAIKSGKLEIERKIATKPEKTLTYTFIPQGLEKGALSSAKSFFSSDPKAGTKEGTAALKDAFKVTCTYEIHLGVSSSEKGQEIKIEGIQTK